MSSNCLACTDPINACPTCPAGQSCVQTSRLCSACPKRICQDTGSSSTKGGGGGPSTGATAGGAVGGVVGVAVVLAAVYFFWWRPRGLAASRKRYSKHLSHRQSKLADKRKSQLAPGETDVATKRSSVHLHIDTAGGDGVNRRNTSPGAAREGGALTPGRTSEDDNPFGDQNRSSIGDFDDSNSIHTSDYSFRSSHTNVIPIAYIPPHSSSMSIADGQRGAFGESPSSRDRDSDAAQPPRHAQALRASIPTSMASRDSLALAGAEIIELHPLPPVLTPDTPAVPHGTLANGAPIRPPRSPGLDLKLPNTPKVSSPLAGSPSSPTRPTSSGALPPVLPPSSGSPGSSPNLSFLSTSPTGGRGMSVLGDPRSRSAQSHMSTMTSRSATSTMSYILDPPQIITPLSAQGVRRVELQKGQAGLVHIGGAGTTLGGAAHDAPTTSPTSPTGSVDPFDDSNRSSLRHSRLGSQGTVTPGGDAHDDTLLRSRPGSSATDTSRWTTGSALSDEGSVQFLQGQTVTFTNPNSPSALGGVGGGAKSPRLPNTASGASFDVPQSARSSEAFDTGSHVRPLTGTMSAWSASPGVSPSSSMGTVRATAGSGARTSTPMTLSGSRGSTASGMSDGSLLEGIPFLAPSTSSAGATAGTRAASTSSVSLGLPVNVTAAVESSAASTSSASVRAPSIVDGRDGQDQDDEPLPAPFLPFAGQRPTSSKPAPSSSSAGATAGASTERVQSAAISVRSGFGSGLSQIPFQLGFPSGFGDDGFTDAGDDDDDLDERDRRSMMSAGGESTMGGVPRSENGPGSVRQSYASSMVGESEDEHDEGDEQVVLVQAERTVVAPVATAPAAQAAPSPVAARSAVDDDASNPFGAHAEVASSTDSGTADPRASMDSLALAMGLAANLDAEASSRA
ncbi:hypothetical protein JCM3775_001823 [Rhodotorula graminis]